VRAVVQRVRSARIRVKSECVGEMGEGLLALVGVSRDDGQKQAEELARKLVHLRVFLDEEGRMNRSLIETGGQLGIVSQFTLFGDARRGRRPSYTDAAPPEQAEPLIRAVVTAAAATGVSVITGRFRAMMDVELVNAGPVTILLDTDRIF
jgi:D-tyrosyl-tRNA(Tyr) deacylase